MTPITRLRTTRFHQRPKHESGGFRESNILRILKPLLFLVMAGALTSEAHYLPVPVKKSKGDPVLGERITKGVALDGRLWLLGPGGLISLGLIDHSRRIHFEEGVVDIVQHDHDLWVLRRSSGGQEKFVLSVWKDEKFNDIADFAVSGKDKPLALLKNGSALSVVTKNSLRTLDSGRWISVPLKSELGYSVQVAIAAPILGGSIYLGFNKGEWGGGLQRIDAGTGEVTSIERRDSKAICSGPLNSACDPVTGVIPDPQFKECVLASVGLVHMFHSTGRILRVCGSKVTVVAEKSIRGDNDLQRTMTEAYYGLAPAADGGGFWAITWRGLYRFDADGTQKNEYALPRLSSVSGIHLSQEIPGTIVVRTDVNWAVSTSGYTPLVVPLEK